MPSTIPRRIALLIARMGVTVTQFEALLGNSHGGVYHTTARNGRHGHTHIALCFMENDPKGSIPLLLGFVFGRDGVPKDVERRLFKVARKKLSPEDYAKWSERMVRTFSERVLLQRGPAK